MDSQIVTLARFRICANATRTPDAITPKDSVTLLKNAMYARAAERSEGFTHIADNKFCQKVGL
ncbi:hypothetical protein [uncultured Helicobacter sp.]|uniref:hypothetical protein n=1 Tax=uncultured Helicobacter sp. TaxID=175537 RepID=UPI0037517134